MLDWERIAQASMHPLQVRILETAYARDDKFSPVELAREWTEPLGNVAYHVRQLLSQGLLKKAGTTSRRGAVQHHYKLADKALVKTAS